MLWTAGKRLQGNKYEIITDLGEGGFGLTYKARQVSLDRVVVIKTPNRKKQKDPNFSKYVTRFRKEARRLAKLPHNAYIVPVIDFFEEEGLPCVVMPFIDGKNLFDFVQEKGRLSQKEALKYICQIAQGLQVVHKAGMVHRDVHPGNIMIRDGEAILIDFGLATEILSSKQSSKHYGNIAFAPYEQMLGEREPTIDIYTLSASFYYTVTGEVAENAWSRRITQEDKGKPDPFTQPNQLVSLDPVINEAICQGMALKAKDRPQSIKAWLSLLEIPSKETETQRFEVVTVNSRGKIRKRQQGQAEVLKKKVNGVDLEMVAIPGGEFMMGSPAGEGISYERPQHRVRVQPFFMGKYPVTQEQWRAVVTKEGRIERELKPEPSRFKGDKRPVENVSWLDAVEYCARLTKLTGKEYRLPSEAEWEYACRAGTKTPFHFGETITSEIANYDGTSTFADEVKGEYRKETTPVDYFPYPNGFGLYDMHGNVWEWCLDPWHGDYEKAPADGRVWDENINKNDNRYQKPSENLKKLLNDDSRTYVLRGGSWYDFPSGCRSAGRSNDRRDGINYNIGFRVLCVDAGL